MSAFGTGTPYVAPAPVSLSFAGFWTRTGAYLIDGILLSIVTGLLFNTVGSSWTDMNIDPTNIQTGPLYAMSGLSFLIPAIYTIGFWVSSGATPGKMALGLKVVRSDTGGPLTIGQAIGRFFGYIVSWLIFGLGFLWVAFDGRKQGWHDKLASTVVVRRTQTVPVAFGA